MPQTLLVSLILLLLPSETPSTLAVVEDVEWAPFREHCRHLLSALDETPQRELTALLERQPKDPQMATAAVQKLLDVHCLIGVSINAESRVKATRGSAIVELHLHRPTMVLVKVHNEAGVTHALRLEGSELLIPGGRDKGRWLKAELVNDALFTSELTGRRLEYRLLRLTPRESGKREATFQFDVGQGTQDLGFRAEVPILFSVRK